MSSIIIDRLYLNGKIYYNVPIEVETIVGPQIEVTCGGLYHNGPEASVCREYRPGLNRSIMRININEQTK